MKVTTAKWSPLWLALLPLLLIGCGRPSAGARGTDAAVLNLVHIGMREYVAAAGGTAVLGDVVSVPLVDAQIQRTVQYFDNFRLEYDRTTAAVAPAALGRWAYDQSPGPVAEDTPPLGVAEAFDAYYEALGGEALFGAPISEVFLEDERWVRYYENTRFEWYPTLPAGSRVRLAPLGRAHELVVGTFLRHEPTSAMESDAQQLLSARVEAAVSTPIVFAGDSQRLVVRVQDPTGRPVADVQVDAVLSWPSGSRPVSLGRTDGEGLAAIDLDVDDVPPGTWITVEVTAGVNERVLVTTRLRFQTWW